MKPMNPTPCTSCQQKWTQKGFHFTALRAGSSVVSCKESCRRHRGLGWTHAISSSFRYSFSLDKCRTFSRIRMPQDWQVLYMTPTDALSLCRSHNLQDSEDLGILTLDLRLTDPTQPRTVSSLPPTVCFSCDGHA